MTGYDEAITKAKIIEDLKNLNCSTTILCLRGPLETAANQFDVNETTWHHQHTRRVIPGNYD